MQERMTKQKEMILDALRRQAAPQSVDGIYARLAGRMARSTIYRNLNAMLARGDIERYFMGDIAALYKIKAGTHEHYLVCGKCRKIVPIPCCTIGRLEKKTEMETGFKITSHYLQMTGICGQCAGRKK
jgi:Fe2+ or Zn2+ uptake regulation protein